MKLQLYNTYTRKKEEFKPIIEGQVGMYTCGPTVYDFSHIGNFRTFMFEDLLKRWLMHVGYDVKHIMNITDIDDKTIKRSSDEGVDLKTLTERYTKYFINDLEWLKILPADDYPRATGSIDRMIDMIKVLIEKGHAYCEKDGSVYFKINTFPRYGKLTNLKLNNQKSTKRINADEYKKDSPHDFALWKGWKKEDGAAVWDAPWGKGRPGWHIECSAMSLNHFGEQFDIHGGGHDLRFPHHEAEIFQSECSTGCEPVVGYWMHNGFVNVDGEKMSKSLGNFWTVREAFENYAPLTLRYALLSIPYRNPIDLSPEFLEDARKHYERLIEAYGVSLSSDSDSGVDLSEASQRIKDAMNDDFNSRAAIIGIQEIVSQHSGKDIATWLEKYAGEVLGLLPSSEEVLTGRAKADSARTEVADKVEALLRDREIARQSKDWNRADEIRDELTSMDVIVEDGPDGPTWRLA